MGFNFCKNMPGQAQRKDLSVGNKYQRIIILLTFLPTFLLCLFLITIVFILNSQMAWQIKPWINVMVWVFSFIFICFFVMIFVVSRNLVGSFSRIIKEMDDILAGRAHHLISSRPQDELANELLVRINVLIQEYLDQRKSSG